MHVFRSSIDGHLTVDALQRELGREDHPVAVSADRFADEFFVVAYAIDVGRVEKRDAQLQRTMERGDRLVPVGGAVGLGHAHAAQSHGGNRQGVRPEMPDRHRSLGHGLVSFASMAVSNCA